MKMPQYSREPKLTKFQSSGIGKCLERKIGNDHFKTHNLFVSIQIGVYILKQKILRKIQRPSLVLGVKIE